MAGQSFDVEAGEDGSVRAAPPEENLFGDEESSDDEIRPPPEPAPPPQVAAPIVKPRIGRPPKNRPLPSAVPTPIRPVSGAPNIDLSKQDDEWPKDIPGLWMRALQWITREQGRDASMLIVWVHQMRGAAGAVAAPSVRFPTPIRGEEIVGGEGISAAEAIMAHLTEVYHLATTQESAQYKIEIQLTSGPKVRSSDWWPLDRAERIMQMRQAAGLRKRDDAGSGGLGHLPGGPWAPPMPRPTQTFAGAPTPDVPAVAPTGNPYVDRYIAHLADENARKERELQDLRSFQSLQPAPAVAPASTPQQDEDVKNAKLATTVAQSVMQTLIAAGVIKPAGQNPAPAATVDVAQAAVRTSAGAADVLDGMVSDIEHSQRREDKFRSIMGLPSRKEQQEKEIAEAVAKAVAKVRADEEEEDPADPPNIHVEPAQRELKTFVIPRAWQGKDVVIPRYGKDDDDISFGQKVANFFGANPDASKDIIQGIVGVAVTKMGEGPLASLVGQLAAQGGAAAMAAGAIRSTVNGAGNGSSGGAGSA